MIVRRETNLFNDWATSSTSGNSGIKTVMNYKLRITNFQKFNPTFVIRNLKFAH